MFLESLTGYSRSVCLNETGWDSDLFMKKLFVTLTLTLTLASALKRLKSRALVHGEIANILFFPFTSLLKAKIENFIQLSSYILMSWF